MIEAIMETKIKDELFIRGLSNGIITMKLKVWEDQYDAIQIFGLDEIKQVHSFLGAYIQEYQKLKGGEK